MVFSQEILVACLMASYRCAQPKERGPLLRGTTCPSHSEPKFNPDILLQQTADEIMSEYEQDHEIIDERSMASFSSSPVIQTPLYRSLYVPNDRSRSSASYDLDDQDFWS